MVVLIIFNIVIIVVIILIIITVIMVDYLRTVKWISHVCQDCFRSHKHTHTHTHTHTNTLPHSHSQIPTHCHSFSESRRVPEEDVFNDVRYDKGLTGLSSFPAHCAAHS